MKVNPYDISCRDTCSDLKIIELTNDEFIAIKLKDIDNFTNKRCSKIMEVTEKEFNNILNSARNKIASSITQDKCFKIIIKEEIEEENIKENELFEMKYCKFRCSICGCVYYINYKVNDIICPKCNSKKVMANDEAGFCKKWIYSK
ncbi:MAG: DUF134 domain-containing protein [Peptostreptococcaceae bacterium]